MLLPNVLQDALSGVEEVYPTMKLKVCVFYITTALEGRNKELPDIAENVLRAMRLEVDEKSFEAVEHG